MPAAAETIEHDDECPVCQHLLYDPVKTECNHILCASCYAQWAETTTENTQISVQLPLDGSVSADEDDDFDDFTTDLADLRASCPMCRTNTTVSRHTELRETLKEKYPATYAQRESEEAADSIGQNGIEGMVIMIGNHHKLEPRDEDEHTGNIHDWRFFVRFSRPNIVDKVRIDLVSSPSHQIIYDYITDNWNPSIQPFAPRWSLSHVPLSKSIVSAGVFSTSKLASNSSIHGDGCRIVRMRACR